jgi:uncharacterized integral membrane protein
MNFKTLFRTVVFLAILFVVLYAGMYNTEEISFSFPLAFDKAIHKPAALIFFAIFAVGVLAGTMLHLGGKGGRGSSKDK